MSSQFVLVLVAIICVSHAAVSDSLFQCSVGEGQSHTGKVGAEFKTKTKHRMFSQVSQVEIFQRR